MALLNRKNLKQSSIHILNQIKCILTVFHTIVTVVMCNVVVVYGNITAMLTLSVCFVCLYVKFVSKCILTGFHAVVIVIAYSYVNTDHVSLQLTSQDRTKTRQNTSL